LEQCLAAGLVWGQDLSIDATKVAANAALDALRPRFAVEAHLASASLTRTTATGRPGRVIRTGQEARRWRDCRSL
jgi:hypothetical protein